MSDLPRKPLDKTIRFNRGSANFSSGGWDWKSWRNQLLLRVKGDYNGHSCLLTPGQMRAFAAELVKRAEYQEACIKAARESK